MHVKQAQRRGVKFPLALDCVQVTEQNAEEVAGWCKGRLVQEFDSEGKGQPGINVPTFNGTSRASLGWWVCREITGEFRVASASFFHDIYELIGDINKIPEED